MKLFYFIIPAFFLSRVAFAQGSCSTTAIESPNVTQPTATGIVSSTCSNLSVKWQGSTGQTYCVYATYFNPTTSAWVTVNGTPNCNSSQSCTATLTVIPGVQVTWGVQAISSGFASYPVTSALEYPINACSGTGVSFCGKVLLQGAYDAATQKMRNTLNTSGILQAQAYKQPYNTTPFDYTGKDSVRPGFFAAHRDVVDWVLVELRDANAPSTIIAKRAAFVKQDGTLVDTSGTNTSIFFPGVVAGIYHVAVRHRNHLGVRTSYPINFSNACCYDFTKSSSLAFRNQPYPSTSQMIPVWTMRGGDANTNADSKFQGPGNDRSAILTNLGNNELSTLNGYYSSDLNMDGTVKYQGPGNDRAFLLATVLTNDELQLLFQQIQ